MRIPCLRAGPGRASIGVADGKATRMDLIVRNARLARTPDAPMVDIGIQGGRIAAIAPNLMADGAEHDAGGVLVCAGLVETHIHRNSQAPHREQERRSWRYGGASVIRIKRG